MSINSIDRPTQWSSLLQYDNKKFTDPERRTIVMNKLEHWSGNNCFLSAGPRPTLKSCRCLHPLHGDDDHKGCVANYILFFGRLCKRGRSMIIIEKLKVLLDVQNRNNPRPFILPFVATQDDDRMMNHFYKSVFICKEALGTVFGIGRKAMTTLVDHAIHHTLPIHGLTGRVPEVNTKFQENVVPPLAYFFKNQIVPMAGARPTQYTRCAVARTVIERDTDDIMELDPGVTKRGLFKEYAYLHGWKIKTTAKGNVIKVPDDINEYNQTDICLWGFFV